MKVRTIIRSRVDKVPPKRRNMGLAVEFLLLLFQTILPFTIGIMFAGTGNILWLGFFLAYMFFTPSIDMEKDELILRIERLI